MSTKSKRILGWYAFDWASQPYHTLMVTFVFAPFFAEIASNSFVAAGIVKDVADAQAQTMWANCMAIVGLLIAFTAPVMGALADTSGRRLPWIWGFSILGFLAPLGLWYVMPDGSNLLYALILFGLGFLALEYAYIFTNSQLPSLGEDSEIGSISGTGSALGYAGGVTALVLVLPFLVESSDGVTLLGLEPAFGLLDGAQREGTRAVGPFVAFWFLIFMVPYFLWMREARDPNAKLNLSKAISNLTGSVKGLSKRRSLFSFLGASMFYRDALGGLYAFGGIYAGRVLEWEITYIGIFGIIAAISASVITWLGGKFDRRFGPKPVITVSILGLIGVCTTVVFMTRESVFGIPLAEGSSVPDIIFFGCGMIIGGFGGTLQSASRSLMVRHTTEENATQAFGLYGLFGRATAFLAPTLVAVFTALTDSARLGVSPLVVLFVIGLILLRWVKPNGERAETWDVSST